MWRLAFFPRRLHPVLERSERDEHSMIAPQMPRGHPIGQAVLHHRADSQGDNPVGVMASRRGQGGQIRTKVKSAARAMMFRVDHLQEAGAVSTPTADFVQSALSHAVAKTPSPAAWARLPAVVSRPSL